MFFAYTYPVLDLSSAYTDLLLHSISLRTPKNASQPSYNDSTQLNGLLSTLEAGKRFLDTLLSFPVHEYHLISFSEWMRLPTVIMTVARLCIPTDAHVAVGWDIRAAQDRVRLDLCLESLCYRMQQLTTYDKATQSHPDFWYAMRFINDLTKSWYMRKITAKSSSQPTPSGITERSTSEISGPSSSAMLTTSNGSTNQGCPSVASMSSIMDESDPFANLKDLDFDMEHFFDMGLWGDETYTSFGFGNHRPF